MADQAQPFGRQFDEAVAFLKGKLPEASLAWDSLDGVVHSKVFTVAGATTADLARDLQESLTRALAEGKTITAFRKDFDQAVQSHGWSYNGKRGWRTQVIFDANMRSANMAGRWQQIQANKDRRPYLQYRTAGDARVRPQHRQWNGLVYEVDSEFWRTHYPPNGWGCRCTVRAYSQGEIEARNITVSQAGPLKLRDVVAADGTLKDRVPVGIDPGWDHNVGRSWIAPELALGERLARLPRELQGLVADKALSPAFQAAIATSWNAFREAVAAGSREATDAQIVGYLDSAVLDGLARAVPGIELQSTAIGAFGDLAGRSQWPAEWLASLPQELRNYRAVLWDRAEGSLLIVPQGSIPAEAGAAQLGVARLRPNATTQWGAAISIERLQLTTAAELQADRGLQVLVGGVE